MNPESPDTSSLEAIDTLIADAEEWATQVLTEYQEPLERVRAALLEHDTLRADQLTDLLS